MKLSDAENIQDEGGCCGQDSLLICLGRRKKDIMSQDHKTPEKCGDSRRVLVRAKCTTSNG